MTYKQWLRSPRVEKSIRRILPRSMLGRSLLIVLIPLLVTQVISQGLFYGNFLGVASRRLSDSVASEIVLSLKTLERLHSQSDKQWFVNQAQDQLHLIEIWKPGFQLTRVGTNHIMGPMDENLAHALESSVDHPLFIDWHTDRHTVFVFIQLSDGILEVQVPRKRLDMGQLWLFVSWTAGSSFLLFLLASLFLRNQVRAIRRLAYAAEQFGLGRDVGPIRPYGAQEVRKAAVAFNRMQDRIYRFISQRTGVLAGVSHDLRTPLTRIRLSLAMLPRSGQVDAAQVAPDIDDMIGDVDEMEHMIDSYLSFARGEGAETPQRTELRSYLEDVVAAARRAGTHFQGLEVEEGVFLVIRPDSIRRALMNLLDNARRHGGAVTLTAYATPAGACIVTDDDGEGINPELRDTVFRAFESGKGGGTGLGLTISRDIIRAHGGDMELDTAPGGGLRVSILLPW